METIVSKEKKDDDSDGDNDVKNTFLSHLGAFILSISKRIKNNFFREMNGFYNNSMYYTDRDGLFSTKKYWDVLDKAELLGKESCQGKKDYKRGVIFYALFLAPKIKYCLTISEFGIIEEHKTFERFKNSKLFLDRSQYFHLIESKKYQLS